MCELQCPEGFNGTGGSLYVCNISGSSVMWMSVGDVWSCEGGNFVYLILTHELNQYT